MVSSVISKPPMMRKWTRTKEKYQYEVGYGIVPESRADYAYILSAIHMAENAKTVLLVGNGVLFREGKELPIRKVIIDKNLLSAVIDLGPGILPWCSVPVSILVFDKSRVGYKSVKTDQHLGYHGNHSVTNVCTVYMYDLAKHAEYTNHKSTDPDFLFQASISVQKRVEIPGFSRNVNPEEIIAHDYNIAPHRYVKGDLK